MAGGDWAEVADNLGVEHAAVKVRLDDERVRDGRVEGAVSDDQVKVTCEFWGGVGEQYPQVSVFVRDGETDPVDVDVRGRDDDEAVRLVGGGVHHHVEGSFWELVSAKRSGSLLIVSFYHCFS